MTDPLAEPAAPDSPARRWTLLAAAASLPLLILLAVTLWRTPYPLSEAVGIFEDVAERPATGFLMPTTSYYRPLFHTTLWVIWHGTGSIPVSLVIIKLLLHILPLCVLVLLLIGHLRPRHALAFAATLVAVAVLVGAPGMLGNLELPLSYTIVGMPAALAAWTLTTRPWRPWHGPAMVALILLAVGFKEQGLIVPAVVVSAWWMRAPGVRGGVAAFALVFTAAYVIFRLTFGPAAWPKFEQDVGFLFESFSSTEAAARFGASPWGIYAYSSLSTMANLLFAEPTEGVFRFVRAALDGRTQPWHVVYFGSSVVTTTLIVWWGAGAIRQGEAGLWRRIVRRGEWTPDARLFVAVIVAVLASGALSFNYSRDRLGGMAVPFYALAAAGATQAFAGRLARAPRAPLVAGAALLVLLAGAWQLRAMQTLEYSRQRAVNTQREWLTDLGRRRARFNSRSVYLHIMQAMTDQGAVPRDVRRTRYPRWLMSLMGEY